MPLLGASVYVKPRVLLITDGLPGAGTKLHVEIRPVQGTYKEISTGEPTPITAEVRQMATARPDGFWTDQGGSIPPPRTDGDNPRRQHATSEPMRAE